MTWLLMATLVGGGLLIGSVSGIVAATLGRTAAETDEAERAAWERWRRPAEAVGRRR
jgi:hypothetical protein